LYNINVLRCEKRDVSFYLYLIAGKFIYICYEKLFFYIIVYELHQFDIYFIQ